MSGHVPARWRLVREDDHLRRWQCDGDGVDLCRAPATWVAEHEANGTLHVVGQRCPDHIPVRAFAGSTLPAPPTNSLQPPQVSPRPPRAPRTPDDASLPSLPITSEMPAAAAVETEPALADTQSSDKFKSPPPPASSSIPAAPADLDEGEDDGRA